MHLQMHNAHNKLPLSFFSIRFRSITEKLQRNCWSQWNFLQYLSQEVLHQMSNNVVFSPSGVCPSCNFSFFIQNFLHSAKNWWSPAPSFSLVKILATVFAELTMGSNRAPKLVRGFRDMPGSQFTFSLSEKVFSTQRMKLFPQDLGLLNL